MGRVARYKKVKAFDPYSQQNRGKALDLDTVGIWGLNHGGGDGRKARKVSQTVLKLRAKRGKNFASRAPVLDAAYEHGDDFDLHDLVGSLKKEALPSVALSDAKTPPVVGGSSAAAASASSVRPPSTTAGDEPTMTNPSNPAISNSALAERRRSDAEEDQKVLRRLKLDAPSVPPPANPIVKAPGRMPGESQRAYQRRVKSETRQIMRKTRQEQHNPEKRQRKKEFLTRKKQSKKPKTSMFAQVRSSHADSDNDDEPNDGTPRAMRVVFGEQVESPPVFRQTPRRATPKVMARSSASGKRTGMQPDQVRAEHDAMEQLRQRVQAQYAQVKAQRKRNGDFHL